MLLEFIKAYGTIAVPIGFLAMLITRSGYYKCDDNLRRSFIVLTFSAICYYSQRGLNLIITSDSDICTWLLSILCTLLIAVLWRKWGANFYFKIINRYGISNENEKGSVLNTIIQDTDRDINGLKVYTKNGKCYSCCHFDWVRQNIDKNALLLIDETGILLPVTDISYPDQEGFTDVTGNGDLVITNVGTSHTYIPKSEIVSYDFIMTKKSTS